MNSLSVNFKVGGSLAISSNFASAVGFKGGTFQVNYEGNTQPSRDFLFQILNCDQGLTPDAYKGFRFIGTSELASSNPTEVLVGLDLSPLTNCWRLSNFTSTLNFQIPSSYQGARGVTLVGFPTLPGGGSYLDVVGDFWSGL